MLKKIEAVKKKKSSRKKARESPKENNVAKIGVKKIMLIL